MEFLRSSTGRLILIIVGIFFIAMLVVAQEEPEEVQGEKWALIVGISDYQYLNDQGTQYTDDDAKEMYKLLTEKAGFSLKDDLHTTFLLNDEATKDAIIDGLSQLTQAKPDDLVLIYFSGHGTFLEDTDGDENDGLDEALVPYDARKGDEGNIIIDDEFGYKIKRLKSKRVIVILDACHSGGAGKSISVMDVRGDPSDSVFKDIFTQPEEAKGRILLAASQPDQKAYERPEFKNGLFTYFLMKALEGEADENSDGVVTIQEAFTYAERRVGKYVKKHGLIPPQTPIMEDRIGKGLTITLVGCPKMVGMITFLVSDKEVARQGDKVLINLGSDDDIQIGDMFEVFHKYSSRGAGSVKEPRGKIKVVEILEENRSLAKVIKLKVPIEIRDQVKRICKFEPPISENKPPKILSINFPSRVTADGNEVDGVINFKDPDGDFAKAEFDVLEAKNFESFDFNPEMQGQTEGSFEFSLSTDIPQKVKLKVTLIDNEGNRSEAREITFQAVKPVKPGFLKISSLTIDPPTPLVKQQVNIRAVIKNTGEKTVTKLVKFYINDIKKETRNINLAPNHKETISFKFTFPTDRTYRIEARTSDNKRSITIRPRKAVTGLIDNHFLSNKNYDRIWDENRSIKGKKFSELVNKSYNRKLVIKPSGDGNKISHEIRPRKPGLLEIISKTTIDIKDKKVELEGRGLIQTANAIFNLKKEERRLEFRTWDGKLTRSKVVSFEARKLGKLFLTSFAFVFVNTEALETVVVDIITNTHGKVISVATTEVFNYIKILSVKTIYSSGFKPSSLNISPHILTFSDPRQVDVNQPVKFKLLAFDPDGKTEKLEINWGDGNTSTITDPTSGMVSVTHRYSMDGTFKIKFTSIDNEGQKESFTKDLKVIKRSKKKKKTEEGEQGEQGEQGEPSGTISIASVD